MKLLPALAGTLAMLCAVATAQAGTQTYTSASIARMSKAQALVVRDQSAATLQFYARHRWMLAPRHKTCWTHVPWAKACNRARRNVQRNRAMLRLARVRLEQLAPQIAHLAGWRCITYGAHPGVPGDPHEGHGDSPAGFHGALQMTATWMGYTEPWSSMTDTAVYAIAEKVAAAQHFAPAWMSGQWPRTYPPCASLF